MAIGLFMIANQINLKAMENQCSITAMPQEIIRHIASFLDEQHDINSLAATCRYLHASATEENKPIKMACWECRGSLPANRAAQENEEKTFLGLPLRRPISVKQFLAEIFTCIQHIVVRHGNNPIELMLADNQLADDMNAVAEFMSQCSQEPIVQHIVSLNLNNNGFIFLPHEIKGLIYLRALDIGHNKLSFLPEELKGWYI